MTNTQYEEMLQGCNWDEPAVSRLITSEVTQMKFNELVLEIQSANPESMRNLFENYFSTEVWPDGQGQDEIQQYATDPHLPYDFSSFYRTMQICDPNTAHECLWNYCEVPEGGKGNLPPIEMYRNGFKTKPDCIANIRHIKNFRYWAARVTRARYLIDEHVIKMFTTLAVLKTLGHKWTLQGVRQDSTNPQSPLIPVQDSNPRNALNGYLYNYMQPFFPNPTDPNLVLPLTYDVLEILARRWEIYGETRYRIGVNDRGGSIFPIWLDDDWFLQEVLRNPAYFESLKSTMPKFQFAGFTRDNSGEQEVVGNFAPRIMPWIPRLTESITGGLVPVDTMTSVDIEIGKEAIPNRDFLNAPFGIALMPSPQQGKLLTRPTLTTSGAGLPIQPITGQGQWEIWNEYDPVCNPEKNMPYSKKKFEMGFKLTDPNAGKGIIYRRRVFHMQPINECDLAPIFKRSAPTGQCDDLFTVGCSDNNRRHQQEVTQIGSGSRVLCTSMFCHTPEGDDPIYNLKVERKVLNPDFNSLGCECGATLQLFVYDANGVFKRQQEGTLLETVFGYPEGYYVVQTGTELGEGECIKEIECLDETPTVGNVFSCYDSTDVPGTVGVVYTLTDFPTCDLGDGLDIKFYSSANVLLGTVKGTIQEMDPDKRTIRVTPNTGQLACQQYENQSYVTVTCNGSSSS